MSHLRTTARAVKPQAPSDSVRVATLGAHPLGFDAAPADRLAQRVDGTRRQLHPKWTLRWNPIDRALALARQAA